MSNAKLAEDLDVLKAGTDETTPQSGLHTALTAISAELGGAGLNFSRGPETEISFKKEIEGLMHELSKHNINVPNQVL